MNRMPLVISAFLILLVITGCGSAVDNATPETAAKSLLKAMIAGDSKTIDALNKSDTPTLQILKDAGDMKIVGSSISDFEFTHGQVEDETGHVTDDKLAVEIASKKCGKMDLRFVFVDGKYFVSSFSWGS